MYVSKEQLLVELPTFRDEWVTVKEDQDVHDIIREMVDSYPKFAEQYDRIGKYFIGGNIQETCDNLYNFCKENIKYREESEKWQTISVPSGILTRGYGDCKAYASFIGGCLGAIGRETGEPIDWEFCFASYKILQREPYHVFVIVHTDNGDIWVDPTPGADNKTPVWQILKKVDKGRVAGVNENGELFFETDAGKTVGATTGDPGADAAVQVSQQISNLISSSNIRGTYFGNWLSDFAKPGQALTDLQHLLFGYKYTGGDYALGEIFIDRVLNKTTYNRWDTPDGIVPLAWGYFTQLFGLPIAVNTDLDTLIASGNLNDYLAGRPEQRGHVTEAQVQRAHTLINMLAPNDKYGQWPPSSFGLLPYAGPIPEARKPGTLYTGTLPNGQQIVNGYPVTAATSGSNIQIGDQPAADAGIANSSMTYIIVGAALLALWWWYSED